MKIELTTSPTKADAQTISQGIVNFNHATIKDLEPNDAEIKFSVFVRDENDQVTGGIRATCYWNTLHIELLWLDESSRGSSCGSEMMSKAEAFARENGFEQALVTTTSWQARPFYEKNGYILMATLPEYPKGYATHFLTKKLTTATLSADKP
jgi:GNAT superfamily N-acetyltransferase